MVERDPPAPDPPARTGRGIWRKVRVEFRAAIAEAMGPPPEMGPVRMSYRAVLAVVLITGVTVLVVGLATEPDGFFGNAVAEASGVLLGAILAVTLIEAVLNRQRREQWETARAEIVGSVANALVATMTDVVARTRTGDAFLAAAGADAAPRIEIAAAMTFVSGEVEAAIPKLAAELDPERASSRSMFAVAERALAPVRDQATTRVIAIGDEPELVRLMLRLERREREWRTGIELVETENAPDVLAWEGAVATLRAMAELYAYLVPPP